MKKKCIVLDLDNTLWGGVVGEEGYNNIVLSHSGQGASFVAFQQALLDLYHRGIILAINSSNNSNDAMEVIEKHPNMILKPHHFAAIRINWNDKVENMRSIAEELNIGLDSMVFLDDNPTNREAMRTFLPEVETPELPEDSSEYVHFMHPLPYFQSEAITDEDKMRGNLYVTERLRRESEKAFADKESFLKSLLLKMKVVKNDVESIDRLVQLTEKTNQFNTNKRPMTASKISDYSKDPNYCVFSARVMDKFGDYGITAFTLVRKETDEWVIESLLLSCRVIGRGVEEALLSAIAGDGRDAGVSRLRVLFVPTDKNKPARDFVDRYFTEGVARVESFPNPEWILIV